MLRLQFLIHFHSSFQDLCSEIDDSKIDMHWDEIEIQSETENENEIKIEDLNDKDEEINDKIEECNDDTEWLPEDKTVRKTRKKKIIIPKLLKKPKIIELSSKPLIEIQNDIQNRRIPDGRGPRNNRQMTHPSHNQKCSICEKVFTGGAAKKNLKSHIRKIHEGLESELKPYACPKCDEKFSLKNGEGNLLHHIRTVHKSRDMDIKEWKCAICDEVFKQRNLRKTHMKEVHDLLTSGGKIKTDWDCSLCEETFKIAKALIAHLKNEHEIEYKCSVCNQALSSNLKLVRHFKAKHPEVENPFVCSICNKSKFKGAVALREHISIVHEKKKPHLCPLCGRSFAKEKWLQTHTTNVHEKKDEYKCSQCEEVFKTPYVLKNHIDKTHKGRSFKCTICNIELSNRLSHKFHMRNKHEGIPEKNLFRCDKCEAVYRCKKSFDRHYQIKHEEKIFKYPCLICPEIYSFESALKAHVRYDHEGKELYKCPHCDKGFRHKTAMEAHRICVCENKPMGTNLCVHCGRSFKRPGTLNMHIKTTHQNIKFPCDQCDKTYSYRAKLVMHQKRIHEGEKGEICPLGCKGFFHELKRHILTVHEKKNAKFPCDVCGAVLTTGANLKAHIKTVHEGARAFDCNFCGRDFTTKQHRDGHLKRAHGQKPTSPKPHINNFAAINERRQKDGNG